MSEPKLTPNVIKVLRHVVRHPGASGAEIGRATKVFSGSLYPALLRMEDAGWLESEWEEGEPTQLGRPRRRFYMATESGVAKEKLVG